MKIVVQRVLKATCTVNEQLISEIEQGMLLLVGFTHDDNDEIVKKMAQKICKLRIFADENQKMNFDISKIKGEIMSISQFTLYGDVCDSNRPSFTNSLEAKKAEVLYNLFNNELNSILPYKIRFGKFGGDMKLDFINDGPVTIILDSKELFQMIKQKKML